MVITLVLQGLSKTTLSLGNPTERACKASGIDAHSPPKPDSRAILSTPRNEFPEIKVSKTLLSGVVGYLLCKYWLWSFKSGDRKLESFLPKNQHTQRKLLNFENWCSGEVSKSAKI